MTQEELSEAASLLRDAETLRKQLDRWVLLQSSSNRPEVVHFGQPIPGDPTRYHVHAVPLPDAVRRIAFREWQRATTLAYNSTCRRLAQLDVQSDHRVRPLPGTGQ